MSGAGAGAPEDGPVLVAGLGNIFLGDDGFGVAALAALARHPLPPRVETADIGVRGVHLAYRLLDGYETVVLLDATARGGAPGTVYLIEDPEPAAAGPGAAVVDGHRMTPDAVLTLLATLCDSAGGTRPRRVLVVGCEPACLDEGIGLSVPVTEAVDEAVALVLRLLATGDRPAAPPVERTKETQP